MIKRIVNLLILVPLAIVLIALSVANRQPVVISADPFNSVDPALATPPLPLFAVLFVALIIGIFIGGIATWLTQGKHRKRAREQTIEARKWHAEADKEKSRAEDILTGAAPGLPAPADKKAA
ncbi:MAG: lipopolysaccharide assembly protein LapA domain-containing protein [Pseudomonadota bacterium]